MQDGHDRTRSAYSAWLLMYAATNGQRGTTRSPSRTPVEGRATRQLASEPVTFPLVEDLRVDEDDVVRVAAIGHESRELVADADLEP